ncbi:MAG: phosphotransferase [Planctomycetota bacterium]|nr:phosphotransferase [Planctomycetota bacterium]
MLNDADALLVEHDPALPVLSVLLDPDALRVRVARMLVSSEVRDIAVDYVRYKPATSCLVRVRIDTSDGELFGYAVGFADVARAKGRYREASVTCDRELVLFLFPEDRHIESLSRWGCHQLRTALLERVGLPTDGVDPYSGSVLRHNPERRFVACVMKKEQPIATLRLYNRAGFAQAKRRFRALRSPVPELKYLGASDRHAAIATQWVEGYSPKVTSLLASLPAVADRLGRLHAWERSKLPRLQRNRWPLRVRGAVESIAAICPALAACCTEMTEPLLAILSSQSKRRNTLHGDLHLDQLLVDSATGEIALLDFDHASLGPPEWDLANLAADLWRRDAISPLGIPVQKLNDTLLAAYPFPIDVSLMRHLTALRLVELAVEPFRRRHRDWPQIAQRLVDCATQLVEITTTLFSPRAAAMVRVAAPVEMFADAALPHLRSALDPVVATDFLATLPSCDRQESGIVLQSIRGLRHKLGRRALIEYQGLSLPSNVPATVLGKLESKERSAMRLRHQVTLWNAGFSTDSTDGICAARPWGEIPQLKLWLQHRMPGQEVTRLLDGPAAERVLSRIAAALAKLHHANLAVERTHTHDDDAELIAERLNRAANLVPELSKRLGHLRWRSVELTRTLQPPETTCIHRDFHLGQALVDGDRVVLLDFDLLCRGDAALDLGNFVGCLSDHGVRAGWTNVFLRRLKRKFYAGYCRPVDRSFWHRVACHEALTLARHIYICLLHADRQNWVETLLEMAEQAVQDCWGVLGSTDSHRVAPEALDDAD